MVKITRAEWLELALLLIRLGVCLWRMLGA